MYCLQLLSKGRAGIALLRYANVQYKQIKQMQKFQLQDVRKISDRHKCKCC